MFVSKREKKEGSSQNELNERPGTRLDHSCHRSFILVAPVPAFSLHVPIPESIISDMAILEQNKALQGCARAHDTLQELHVALRRESNHQQLLHVRMPLLLSPLGPDYPVCLWLHLRVSQMDVQDRKSVV